MPPSSRLNPPVAAVEPSQTTPVAAADTPSYGQILKSSALIGGASVINVAVSIVRGKAMALMLGPAGIGLMGLYTAILDLTQSVAGMGINSSGVRQIAEAAGSGDSERVARTATVLRRTSLFLGLAGAVLIVVLCRPVSVWTFGTAQYAVPVALLSLAVLFQLVSGGQTALIHGMRRIGDLARIAVAGAFFSAAISLALVYFFRERGLVPALVSSAAITLISSWWYGRKIRLPAVSLTPAHVRDEAGALLKLGTAFMASAVLTTAAAYAIRTVVGNRIGLDAAGLYQCAWTLGGVYIGFILQAMGSDFYPRLTAAAGNHVECNRLVNEQAQVGLLLAGPGVTATLTFAPLVVALLYDTTFMDAVEPLRWICLGMALRVVAWPMGFIILAKGARGLLIWTELAAAVVHVGLAMVLVRWFGVTGATMAFFGLYIWHGMLVYVLVRRLTGFRWSAANRRDGLFLLPPMGGVFVGFFLFPGWIATAVGVAAIAGTTVYSLRRLCTLVSLDAVPRVLRSALVWSGIASADSAPRREGHGL